MSDDQKRIALSHAVEAAWRGFWTRGGASPHVARERGERSLAWLQDRLAEAFTEFDGEPPRKLNLPAPGELIIQMLLSYRRLRAKEGDVVVVLYGDNLAAVLEPDAPRVKALIAGIELEKDIADG
jgi:hypothetical protein